MEYKLVYSSRKTVGLNIGKSGELIVRAPLGCPKKTIEGFIREQRGWIEKQRARLEKEREEADAAGELSPEEIKRMAEELRAVLNEKLPYYASLLGVSYGNVTIRCQKSKWGSCTSKGNLNFNCLLMLAPEEVLDYVIVHELCHRRHMDHSPRFWALVESVMPDHASRRKWLKDNGGVLLRRAGKRAG